MTARLINVTPIAIAVFLISSAPLEAQDHPAAVEDSPVKMEIGAAAMGFLPPARTYGLGVRVTKAIDDRFLFEAELDWMDLGRKARFPDQVIWLYFWQVRHMLVTEKLEPRFFATYGTAGIVERTTDGRRLGSALILPFLPMIGFGGQHLVAKRLIIRADAQFIWLMEALITPRFSAGVSIPIGGY